MHTKKPASSREKKYRMFEKPNFQRDFLRKRVSGKNALKFERMRLMQY